MVVVGIIGILFSAGFGYFFSGVWQEHRISEQKHYLQREARFAMDFIINGTMQANNQGYFRFGGIIGSHFVEISNDPNSQGGNVITLKDKDNNLTGRIMGFPAENPVSLIFDVDQVSGNGNEFVIIPHQVQDEPGAFGVTVNFSQDPNNPSLIGIGIQLDRQTPQGRDLTVRLYSSVALRNVGGI